MTSYEWLRLFSMPFMSPLYSEVRALLRAEVPPGSRLLDIGGRKSWYTAGLPVEVTVTDLPRESSVQQELHLGVTDEIANHLASARSNVAGLVLDDMTRTELPDAAFDAAVSVEVIEHVDDDEQFVRNLAAVLRPGGVAVLTTPNGDRTPVPVGDHRRHYRRHQLEQLLGASFSQVSVNYAVPATRARKAGLSDWSPRQPVATIASMAGNLVNHIEASRPTVRYEPSRGAHLIAVARKG